MDVTEFVNVKFALKSKPLTIFFLPSIYNACILIILCIKFYYSKSLDLFM